MHRWQRALAASAVLATVPALLWTMHSHVFALHVLTALSVAVPLFLPHRPVAFTRACLIVGLALLPWGVLGLFLAMFLFWPAALLLLLAAFADPRRSRWAARITAGAGALLMAGVLAGTAAYCWHFYVHPALAEPHTFRAVTHPDAYLDSLGVHETRLQELGATGVTGTWTDELPYLDVSFPESLPEDRRTALKEAIAKIPGVTRVELCPVRECG
ncbi:hypothetical protein AMK26_26485 [Streptomyces sp. CB03234]|nr:hypothetical protein AMK26_26485 [Streptomyces sp. CB03234]